MSAYSDTEISYAFFGTSEFAVYCLERLKERDGPLPRLIITTPNRRQGRGLELSPPPVRLWAKKEGIDVLQPEALDSSFANTLNAKPYTLFLVASYGRLMPKNIFEIPECKTLNLHPSLLPRYRGPSPIESQILADESEVGVSVIQIDEKTDHGPIVSQNKVKLPHWPMRRDELEKILAEENTDLFIKILPDWLGGTLQGKSQNESLATFTKKLLPEDGLIELSGEPKKNYLKFCALYERPGTHFVASGEKPTRVSIKNAELRDGKFVITRVTPAGRKEISYEEFRRGYVSDR